MELKSRQQIASLPLELIDRWPPIIYHNSLLGSGFATNQAHSPLRFSIAATTL